MFELKWDPELVVCELQGRVTERRLARIEQVVENRTYHVAPVLENIYDRGNVSAVMRSSEAFGFLPFYRVDLPDARFKAANRVTQGADKWLDIHQFDSSARCVENLKSQGYQVLATDLEATSYLDDFDFSQPTAIVLGNEKDGISSTMRQEADHLVKFPMHGFTQSFNISVAGALCFHHIYRDRVARMGQSGDLSAEEKLKLKACYLLKTVSGAEEILRGAYESKKL